MVAAPAQARPEPHLVKVRFAGERRFKFVSDEGRLSALRLHAVSWNDLDEAVRAAEHAVTANPTVEAATVTVSGRVVHRVGPPVGPAVAPYGPDAGYRWLIGAGRTGRAVFHVKDEAGDWAPVTWKIATECFQERARAGLTGSIRVHGTLCHMGTGSLRFVQETNRRCR